MDGAPRTLLITERYLPEVGGSFVWFANTYRRHPPGTVWIVTRRWPGDREADAQFPGIGTIRLSLRRWRFLRPESLMLVLKLVLASLWNVRRRSIRILHAAKVLPEGLAARIVSKITAVPYVVYTHGEELTLLSANPSYGPHFARLRAVYNDAAAVIANSRFTRDELVRFGVEPARIVRISPGVDLSLFSPGPPDAELRRRYALDGKLVLLSVGRLQKRKGHDRVLEALAKVLPDRPELVYVVVSAGEEEA
ncbi:MAG: glycosyltransferase, partial [Candidatus Binatia bacterium]